MPKSRPQRRIDRNVAQVARNITVTGGGTGGGLTSHTHSQYATDAEVIARVASAIATHSADEDAHHDRLHDILGVDDHEITAAAYTLVGATLTDTLGKLYIASSGDGIDVTKSGGTFTIDADVSDFVGDGLRDDGSNNVAIKPADFAGNGLIESSYDLHVGAGEGITVGSNDVAVDESYDFAWTGDHTFAATLGSPSYVSGFAGGGWRIDTDDASMQLNDLTVRGLLRVYELLVQQIRATNGSIFVSAGAKIASAEIVAGSTYELTVDAEESDTDIQPFAVNDLIRAQRWTGQGTYQCDMQVTTINQGGNPLVFRATLEAGDAPAAGMEFVRLGNVSDGDRQGSIYFSADDNEAPFIDIIDSVESFAAWASTNKVKARLGNLTGITDADMGVLSGYGLYTENGYFRGTIAAGGGNTLITEAGGLTLQSTATGGSDDSWITFATDPTSITGGTRTGYIFGSKIDTAGTVRGGIDAYAFSGATNTTDIGHIGLYTQDDGEYDSFILIESGSTQHQITISSYNGSESAFGTIAVVGNGDWTGHVVPNVDGTYDLGSASKAWRSLYVDTLYAGTVSSVDTGHNHNDLYYTEAEIDSFLSGKSDTGHTHAGYVTSVSLATTLSDYVTSSGLTTALADYYTEAEADALLANKSAVGHTHDSRYYTETEVDALIAGVAAAAHTHDDRYYTETEVDALLVDLITASELTTALGSYVTSAGLTATLGGYYSEAEVDALLTDYSLTTHTHTSLPLTEITYGGSATINIANDGTLSSSNYVSGRTGYSLGPAGMEASNADIRGVLRSGLLQAQGTLWSYGSQIFGPSAKLRAELTVTAIGTQVTVAVDDADAGHVQVFAVGEVLKISGPAYVVPETSSDNSTIEPWLTFAIPTAVLSSTDRMAEVWMEVDSASDETTHWEYTCTVRYGPRSVFSPGAVIGSYGTETTGRIQITSDALYAPYMDVFTTGATPWTAVTSHLRIGKLDGLVVGSSGRVGSEYGLAAATDLSDATGSWLITSNQRIAGNNITQTITNASGDPAVELSPNTGLSLYYDINLAVGSIDDDRRVSWLDPDDDRVYFQIGPDDFFAETFGIRAKPLGKTDNDSSGLHIWAGPESIDFVSPTEFEEPRYAGIQLWSYDDMIEYLDDEDELISVDRQTSEIWIVAENVRFYGNASIDDTLIWRNFTTSTDDLTYGDIDTGNLTLSLGQIYADADGYLKIRTT